MLVVGDCFAAKPSAQHATTAACGFGLMEKIWNTNNGIKNLPHEHTTTATCDSELMETLEHKQRHKELGKLGTVGLVNCNRSQ